MCCLYSSKFFVVKSQLKKCSHAIPPLFECKSREQNLQFVFIFDDYGLPPGEVKKAIDDKLLSGELRDIKFIGEKPSDLVSASGTKFFDMEGCICNA